MNYRGLSKARGDNNGTGLCRLFTRKLTHTLGPIMVQAEALKTDERYWLVGRVLYLVDKAESHCIRRFWRGGKFI